MRPIGVVRKWVPWLLAAAAAGYLLRELRVGPVVEVLRGADQTWIFGPALFSLCAYLLVRGARWWFLLGAFGIRTGFVRSYLGAVAALGVGAFTPLQAGELAKAETLDAGECASRTTAYAVVLLEKVLDFVVLTAVVVSTSLSGGMVGVALVAAAIVVTFVVLGPLALVRLSRLGSHEGATRFVNATRPRTIVLSLLLTAACWGLVSCLWASLLRAVDIRLGFLDSLQLVSMVTLAAVLSLLPGGVGVADAGAVAWLRHTGIELHRAQAAAVVLRLAGIGLLLFGVLHGVVLGFLRRGERPLGTEGSKRHATTSGAQPEE